jgi:hypothetical protein
MPQLTFPIAPDGLLVDVMVAPGSAELKRRSAVGQAFSSVVWGRGLIDTGSNVTGISLSLLQQLQLQPVRPSSTQGIGGTVPVDLFWVSLSITDKRTAAMPLFTPPDLLVMELTLADVEVLIGRDVLPYCKLTIDGRITQFTLEW